MMAWLIMAVMPWIWRAHLPVKRANDGDQRVGGTRLGRLWASPPLMAGRGEVNTPTDTALIDMAARLQAGQSVPAALAQSLGTIDAPWARYLRAKIAGVQLPIQFPQQISVADAQAVHAVSAATQLVHQYGMELSAILQASVNGIIATREADEQRTSALAGPRTTAKLLQWLPLVALVAGTVMGADPLRVLLAPGWGHLCLLTGVGFMLAGRIWLTRLIRLAERGELSHGSRRSGPGGRGPSRGGSRRGGSSRGGAIRGNLSAEVTQ